MIAGILVLLGRCFGSQRACGVIICRFTCPVACLVVGIYIGLAKVGVILPGQLAQLVIGVPGHMAALVGDSGDVAAGVIGVGIPGGSVSYGRLIRADLPGGAPGTDLPVPVVHHLGEAGTMFRCNGLRRQAV